MVQKDAEQEGEMRTEIQQMKKEQSSISMMDEFARYARLERKINKTTDKLKTHGKMKANPHIYEFKRYIIPQSTFSNGIIYFDSKRDVLTVSRLFGSAATDDIQQLQEVAGGSMFTKWLLGATAVCRPLAKTSELFQKQTSSLFLSGQMCNIFTTA